MRRTPKWTTCFIMLPLIGLTLLAQSQETSDTPSKDQPQAEIEETVAVWGTLVNTSTLKLEGESLALKQADHISDLLRSLPGVDVGGAHSLNQRITIRSMDDKDLMISIDGANQNSYMYHHMGNLQIHADILKSVDLDVGKNSVVHGGLGGAVRFETKSARDLLQGEQSFGARLHAAYGSNQSNGYSATGFGMLGELDVLVYYNQVQRENFEVGGGEIRDETGSLIAGTDGTVRGHEGDLGDGLLKLGWQNKSGHRLELSFESYRDEGDYSYRPDMGLATDLAIAESLGLPLTYPTEFERETAVLNYRFQRGSTWDLRATAFVNDSSLSRDESGVAAVFGGASQIDGIAENSGLQIQAKGQFGERVIHRLTYGGTWNDYQTDYRADTVPRSAESTVQTALYLEDRIQLSPKLTLTPGIRWEEARLDSKLVDRAFTAFTAGLSTEYQVAEHLSLELSGTQLFKAPEIGEVFIGAGLNDVPNPDIQSEQGHNLELGLATGIWHHASWNWQAGANLFRTHIDRYIYDYASVPGIRFWKDNVGDMEIEGLETYLGVGFGQFHSLATISLAESELSANETYAYLEGARIDRQQGDTYSLDLSYTLPQHHLTLKWVGIWATSVPQALDLDGATLNNAKDGYNIQTFSLAYAPNWLSGLSFNFGIDNVFDEYFASQSSRTGVSAHPRFGNLYLLDYEPGRNIKATLNFTF